jgi:hypothetical protein
VVGVGGKVQKTVMVAYSRSLTQDNIIPPIICICSYWKANKMVNAGSGARLLYITPMAENSWSSITLALSNIRHLVP